MTKNVAVTDDVIARVERLHSVLSGDRLDAVQAKIAEYATTPRALVRDRATKVTVAASNDDFGTGERRLHDDVAIEGQHAQTHARVLTGSVLDRMLNRKELAGSKEGDHQRLWNAGDRLRSDFYLAGMEPRVISTLTPLPGGKGEMTDRSVDARTRVRQAEAAVGSMLFSILLHVIRDDQAPSGWGKHMGYKRPKDAVPVFRVALEALCIHYGT